MRKFSEKELKELHKEEKLLEILEVLGNAERNLASKRGDAEDLQKKMTME